MFKKNNVHNFTAKRLVKTMNGTVKYRYAKNLQHSQ